MERSPLRYAVWTLMVVVLFNVITIIISMLTATDIEGLTIVTLVVAGLLATALSRIASQEENQS